MQTNICTRQLSSNYLFKRTCLVKSRYFGASFRRWHAGHKLCPARKTQSVVT